METKSESSQPSSLVVQHPLLVRQPEDGLPPLSVQPSNAGQASVTSGSPDTLPTTCEPQTTENVKKENERSRVLRENLKEVEKVQDAVDESVTDLKQRKPTPEN